MTITAVTNPPGLQCDDCGLVVLQPNRLHDVRGWAAQAHQWVRRAGEDFCPLCAEASLVVPAEVGLNRRGAVYGAATEDDWQRYGIKQLTGVRSGGARSRGP